MATVREIVMDWLADDRRPDPETLIRRLEEAKASRQTTWRPLFADGPINADTRSVQGNEAFTPYRR